MRVMKETVRRAAAGWLEERGLKRRRPLMKQKARRRAAAGWLEGSGLKRSGLVGNDGKTALSRNGRDEKKARNGGQRNEAKIHELE